MPKTRRERRKARKDAYLDGRARKPHHHTPVLKRALKESRRSSSIGESPSTSSTSICLQCKPVLSRYIDTFKGMVHQGTELKRKIAINPHPKKSDMTHNRDLVNQNEWLRQNMFDSLGNYSYCCECIRLAFGISKDRISRQRNIKCLQSQQPIVEMAKSDIEKQRLGAFVLMPPHLDISFNKWWRSEDPSTMIQVQVPHERHGNAGKVSNSAKTTVHQDFIEFVDINTQPNGQ